MDIEQVDDPQAEALMDQRADDILDEVMADVSGDDYPPDPDEDSAPHPHATQMRQRIMQRHQVQTLTPKQVKRGDRLLSMEKRRKALELRKGGATYEQIAKATGYSQASSARKAVVKALGDVIQEPALEVKTIQIERLNHMLLTLWPKVQQGDERAIDTALRVMDKIDRLMGTEMAKQVDINVNHQDAILVIGGNKDDYIAAMKRMVGVDPDGNNVIQGSVVNHGDDQDMRALQAGQTPYRVPQGEVFEEPARGPTLVQGVFQRSTAGTPGQDDAGGEAEALSPQRVVPEWGDSEVVRDGAEGARRGVRNLPEAASREDAGDRPLSQDTGQAGAALRNLQPGAGDVHGQSGPAAGSSGLPGGVQPLASKKKYRFSMDPTVNREKK